MKKTLLLKLLATKQLQVTDGLIELEHTHFNLLPALFISSLTEHYHRQDDLHKLYLIAWFWGFDLVRAVAEDLGLNTPDEIYKVGMDLAESMGMGLYKSHDYHPGTSTKFRIETNPYLRYINLDRVDGPIDYFVSGAMAGGGCHVHDAVCQNIELHCKGQDDDVCEFLTATAQELRDRDLWQTVEKRYSVDAILKFQQDVFNNYTRDDATTYVDRLHHLLTEI